MILAELFTVITMLAGIAYWLDGMNAKDIARRGGHSACQREGVQFLDQSVVLIRLRLHRDGLGRLKIWRQYRFEFTSDSRTRYRGEIALLGKYVEGVHLEPYRIP